MTKIVDTVTFVDESGLNCLVRNLKPEQDNCIALLCALPVPRKYLDSTRSEVRVFYEMFCNAAPPGATLHITDAFVPGHESWRAAAENARHGIFELIRRHRMYVVYAARRARIARESFEREKTLQDSAVSENKTSRFRVPGIERPCGDNILRRAMTTLSLRVNEFIKLSGSKLTDFYIDKIDDALLKSYKEALREVTNWPSSSYVINRRDVQADVSERVTLNIDIEIDRDIDVSHIGDIVVVGKDDPMIFAIDIISNALLNHLRALPSHHDLNIASSVSDWDLYDNTFIDRRQNAAPPILDII